MTLITGICTDTSGQDDLQALTDLGNPLVRVALTKAHSEVPQFHRLRGRQVLGCVAGETFAAFGLDIRNVDDHRHGLTLVQQRWGALLTYVELGNEPDDPGDASTGMHAEVWTNLLRVGCAVFHPSDQHNTPQLISGGLSSGQPSYLNGIEIPNCNLLGLHDYNSRMLQDGGDLWPAATYGFHELGAYLGAYESVWSKLRGVAITEWGITDDVSPFAGQYIEHWLSYVRRWPAITLNDPLPANPPVKLACWFSLSDNQHPVTPHGLLRRDGVRKPQFTVYRDELAYVPVGLSDRQRLALLAAPAASRR